jgi:hypothetical protein
MRCQVFRLICLIALVGGLIGAGSASAGGDDHEGDDHESQDSEHDGSENELRFDLAPSSPNIARCLPQLKARVHVDLETAQEGRDKFKIEASGLPPNQEFTVFLLEIPGSPFGAAEYIGDFSTDEDGRGENTFKLIVEEAFSSTLVNGNRVRADLNHVGFWFADPAGDDVCFGAGKGAVTPFDGDNEAGVQVMNSANSLPGAPLPPP